ncbi:PIN domain-containing protein [Novipirellula rosea]|uniref:PIN domain-containing protein n=1 Tax=Novipirellula rosea TaxID=1031540 RepID=A0ABP8MNI6_9BACT
MSHFPVVYDACVLFPAPLRDLLMQLALTGLFRARWSSRIHDEWTRSVLKVRPDLTVEQLSRTRQLIDSHVLDALVTGFEPLIDALELPDPDDRHVLAAAIRCGADAIVTYNLKDFPDDALSTYVIEAIHPDSFLLSQLDLASSVVPTAVKQTRARLKNPPKSPEEYLGCLGEQRLTQTVSELRCSIQLI